MLLRVLAASFILLICHFTSYGQNKIKYAYKEKILNLDTSFVSKVQIDSCCPCKTTITDLKKSGILKDTVVEEMDDGKRCIATDARFENGKGYCLSTKPGIIFQKEDSQNETISKIRLTKDFTGNLPNGVFIKMKDLKLMDVLKMYPNLEFSTRDCSDYWKYSNDTISFYIRVDTTKPRYPLDENYYANKSIASIDIAIWCYKLFNPISDDNLYYEKPTYSPFSDTHLNCYARIGFNEVVKLGRWIEYSPSHKIISDELYDEKGNIIKK